MKEELAREMVQIMDNYGLEHNEKMTLMMLIATSAFTEINEDNIANAFGNVMTDNMTNAFSDIAKLVQKDLERKEVEDD